MVVLIVITFVVVGEIVVVMTAAVAILAEVMAVVEVVTIAVVVEVVEVEVVVKSKCTGIATMTLLVGSLIVNFAHDLFQRKLTSTCLTTAAPGPGAFDLPNLPFYSSTPNITVCNRTVNVLKHSLIVRNVIRKPPSRAENT